MRYHHMSHKYRGEDTGVVRCVEVANAICTLKGITSIGRKLVKPSVDTFRMLELEKEDIVILATDLDDEISRNECLFET